MTKRNTVALVLAVTLAGCGDPYAAPTTSSTSTASGDPRQPPPERLGERPPVDRTVNSGAGAPTPAAAIRRYAELSINWTAASLAGRQRELARIAVGGARQSALRAAARIADDGTLRRAEVSNSGEVIAVAPGSEKAAGAWVIVTREQTHGRGTYRGLPATHHVTFAEVEKLEVGWVVSSWRPLN